VLNSISDQSLLDQVAGNRPDTSWSIHCITNIAFEVYPIQDHLIGCPVELPSYIKNNKAVISAHKDTSGKIYEDKLCLFRALALMQKGNDKKTLEKTTRNLFEEYCEASGITPNAFEGISIENLEYIESIFCIAINVYQLSDDGCAELLYRSTSNHTNRLNLNLYHDHFSWITDLRMYTKSYKCSYCCKLFKYAYALNQHALSCKSQSKFIYPNGPYSTPKSIFSKLEEIGIVVQKELWYHPYFCVFDCEAYFDLEGLPKDSKSTVWEAKHRLASISVCSNVPGFTDACCFVNDENNEYFPVKEMMKYLTEMQTVSSGLLSLRYNNVYTQIEFLKEEAMFVESEALHGRPDLTEDYYNKLATELDEYLSELLCFGFNSGKYDIPLIKPFFIKFLLETNSGVDYVIKKCNDYVCIKANNIKFLDIKNFLAAGVKYDEYLAAMGVRQRKFSWPYEKFTSLEYLKKTNFPSYFDFYSKLTNSNISQEQYDYCKSVWNAEEMTTLRDLLVYYNNHDVIGFVEAITTQRDFFIARDLDFKSAVSVPGLAIQYLFQVKDKDSPIFLFGERHKDLYHLVRDNIRGGLSMVFTRYQHIDNTKIKPEIFGVAAKTTKGTLGVDFSGTQI
jgi:hypothetical protein